MAKTDLALTAAIDLQCRLHAHSGDLGRLQASLAEWVAKNHHLAAEVADRVLAPGCAKPAAMKTAKVADAQRARLAARAQKRI